MLDFGVQIFVLINDKTRPSEIKSADFVTHPTIVHLVQILH